jgi:hypothetical protein
MVLPFVCCSVLLIAGCGSAGDPGGRTAEPSPGGPGGPSAASSPGCQVIVRGFSCLMQERIEAARSYLADAPGRVGLVLHDRVTGANTLTQVAAILFQGRQIPVPDVSATP